MSGTYPSTANQPDIAMTVSRLKVERAARASLRMKRHDFDESAQIDALADEGRSRHQTGSSEYSTRSNQALSVMADDGDKIPNYIKRREACRVPILQLRINPTSL